MIEVEKKFVIEDDTEEILTRGAQFTGEKKFTDIYYDDSNYSLTKRDLWLRNRDGKYELKVPFNESLENRVSDQYQELETEQEINKYLQLNSTVSFREALELKGYQPFCKMTTTRKKYKSNPFTIDIDSMDFGYKLAEIELMIDDISKVREATESIVAYAKKIGLNSGEARGKVVEYLKTQNPNHFQALRDAKIFR